MGVDPVGASLATARVAVIRRQILDLVKALSIVARTDPLSSNPKTGSH